MFLQAWLMWGLFFSVLHKAVAAQEKVTDFGDLKLCLCSSWFVQQ